MAASSSGAAASAARQAPSRERPWSRPGRVPVREGTARCTRDQLCPRTCQNRWPGHPLQGTGWWLSPSRVAGGLRQHQHLQTPLRVSEHPASSTAGPHFPRQEETRVLAPHGRGLMQDQLLAGSGPGHPDAPGRAAGCGGWGGKAPAGPPWLVPSAGPVRVSRAGKRVCPSWEEGLSSLLALHLLSPGAPRGHQSLGGGTAGSK